MSRRNIHFEFLENEVEVDFGNWVMILVYARSIDREKFLILQDYNKKASLETENVTFDIIKLEICIEFVTQLILGLSREGELEYIYSEDKLIEITNNEKDFGLTALFEDDNLFWSNEQNIDFLEYLRDRILKPSLLYEIPHAVYIESI